MGDIHVDMKRAMQAIRDAPFEVEPTVALHSPKCRAVETGRLRDCNCTAALHDDAALERPTDPGKLTR